MCLHIDIVGEECYSADILALCLILTFVVRHCGMYDCFRFRYIFNDADSAFKVSTLGSRKSIQYQ